MLESRADMSGDGKYRYRLSRIWNRDRPVLLWIMLNPSTADGLKDDPTIHKCIAFSLNAGYGGMFVHNLFSYRTNSPAALWRAAVSANGTYSYQAIIGPGYDNFLADDARVFHDVCCAWGSIRREFLPRAAEVVDKLKSNNLLCLKRSPFTGQPAHPLYLSSKLDFQPFAP